MMIKNKRSYLLVYKWNTYGYGNSYVTTTGKITMSTLKIAKESIILDLKEERGMEGDPTVTILDVIELGWEDEDE